jgi:hypothetical protein
MENLPDALRVPDGPEKPVLPSRDLPVSKLIKLDLPPQHKSSTFTDPSDYLSDRPPTLTMFNVLEIPVPPAAVVKALSREILSDPDMMSILLVHSPGHRAKHGCYLLWLATIWSMLEPMCEARTLWRSAVDQLQVNLEKSTTSKGAAD